METIPKNGWMELKTQPNKLVELYDRVPTLTLAQYECHEGYHNFGVTENLCVDRSWTYEVPNCERFCKLKYAVLENELDKAVCVRDASKIPCTDLIQIGTYLITVNEKNEIIKQVCTSSGEWDLTANTICKHWYRTSV